ncbi:hypothetical protein GF352_05120 [archaeon]|nr:hypothetical protein [archaeon]
MLKICTPFHSTISRQTHDSIKKLRDAGFKFEWRTAKGCHIVDQRNSMIPRDGSDMLCLDADIAFEPHHVKFLIDAAQKDNDIDVIGGLYSCRNKEDTYCASTNDRWWEGPVTYITKESEFNANILPVNFIGAGFLYVTSRAIDKMDEEVEDGYFFDYLRFNLQCGIRRSYDDEGFCFNACDAGIKLFAHTLCVVNHITDNDGLPDRRIKIKGLTMAEIETSMRNDIAEIEKCAKRVEGCMVMYKEVIKGLAEQIALKPKYN